MRAPESPFERCMSKRILSFAYLMRSSVSGAKALNTICHIQFQWKVTEHFPTGIRKIWRVRTKIALIVKIFRRKKFAGKFCCLGVNPPTVKIWRQSDKFTTSFSFLQYPLQVKKLIRENSAKQVNQTGNFLFQPKLKTAIFENFYLDESSCLDIYINLKIKISTKWSVWRCTVTLTSIFLFI